MRRYTLPNNYSWPEVKSIYIDGYDYVNSTIYAGGVQTVNSTVTLSQVGFSQPYEGECTYFQLNLGGHRLILDTALSFGTELWSFADDLSGANTSVECSLVGTAESVLEITGGGYKAELWCDMDIGKVILTEGNIDFRGSGETQAGDLIYRDGRYYFYENGVMAASKEAYVNGAWCWFDADGSMAVSKDVYQTSSGGK